MEVVRSDLKIREEIIKEEFKEKINEKISLASGALLNISNNKGVLYQKKVDAVELIWKSISDLASAKNMARTVSSLNIQTIEADLYRKTGKGLKALEDIRRTFGGFDLKNGLKITHLL